MTATIQIQTPAGSNIVSFTGAILANIVSIARGAGAIRITGANGDQVTIKGSGFTYDVNGFLTGGTATSVSWLNNGANYAVASAFSLDAALVASTILTGTVQQFFNLFPAINFVGNDGIDTGYGGLAGDSLSGGLSDDQLYGNGGSDTIAGGDGGDLMRGGSGTDTLDYRTSAAGVTVNLQNNTSSGGDAQGDNFNNFESVWGSAASDRLSGNAIVNELKGGNGDDVLKGGAGGDTINGGIGSDTASYTGSSAAVVIDLSTNIVSGGDAAGDTLISIENVEGSGFGDTITGSSASNKISGGAGDDTLNGGENADTVSGGAGADRIIGGRGIDHLSGGADADTFVLATLAGNRDIISNFVAGIDTLEVSAALFKGGLLAGVDLTAGQLAINATGLAGGINDRFILNSATGELFYDINGSVGGANGSRLVAEFSGAVPVLTIADFDVT